MADKDFQKSLWNMFYYDRLNNQLEREVGDWLRANADGNPKAYSNDIRHQYVSALYGRNKGPQLAKLLGDLHEMFNISEGESSNYYDKAIDKYNNNLGIQYGINNPNASKEQLLRIMYDDFYKNKLQRKRDIGF